MTNLVYFCPRCFAERLGKHLQVGGGEVIVYCEVCGDKLEEYNLNDLKAEGVRPPRPYSLRPLRV